MTYSFQILRILQAMTHTNQLYDFTSMHHLLTDREHTPVLKPLPPSPPPDYHTVLLGQC